MEDNGTLTRVAAFPIGIDPERFVRALETEEVQINVAKLLNRYAGRKVIVLKAVEVLVVRIAREFLFLRIAQTDFEVSEANGTKNGAFWGVSAVSAGGAGP